MSEYLDRNQVIDLYEKYQPSLATHVYEFGEKLRALPIVEQRQHGTWVDVPKYKGFYVCSKCLERLDGDFERFDHWEMKKDNFCSVCGSDNRKMGDQE